MEPVTKSILITLAVVLTVVLLIVGIVWLIYANMESPFQKWLKLQSDEKIKQINESDVKADTPKDGDELLFSDQDYSIYRRPYRYLLDDGYNWGTYYNTFYYPLRFNNYGRRWIGGPRRYRKWGRGSRRRSGGRSGGGGSGGGSSRGSGMTAREGGSSGSGGRGNFNP